MLTKCMLTPLKLARLMEWNGRLGKPSAIMAVDITNHQIGIALAYHRQLSQQQSRGPDDSENETSSSATSITALPPIPYMSHEPYHPSYAFLHHHRSRDDMTRNLDRVERTVEVADQLAQLAHAREVKGVLVRWPGDLASAVDDASKGDALARHSVEEGQLLFSMRFGSRPGAGNSKSDGSMGYMRGRILYLLDKCCTSHGHNLDRIPPDPFLVEGSRPFALWDTSRNEEDWIEQHEQSTLHKADRPLIPKREDKYGNSMTEMDQWGRAAIYGNEPPPQKHGQFYYSSKQKYSGYRVSRHFDPGSSAGAQTGTRSQPPRNENFTGHHDSESKMRQFQGSLSAMHALYDFANENLEGRIVLPTWISSTATTTATATATKSRKEQLFDQGFLHERQNDGILGYREDAQQSRAAVSEAALPISSSKIVAHDDKENNDERSSTTVPPTPVKKTNGLATLVPMPKRKARRRGKRGAEAA